MYSLSVTIKKENIMLRIDVSEIKTFRGCKREWELSSRNRMHLTTKTPIAAFAFGTIFHEALHALYLGQPLESVMDMVRREMDPATDNALLAMVPGYAKNVLPGDLARYTILEIEHKFQIKTIDPEMELAGSIDMIAIENATNEIWGFEHKSAKSFRDPAYLWMDEQPRIYTFALLDYVEKLNLKRYQEWRNFCSNLREGDIFPDEPEPYKLGGIYINEVKKLLRDFQYQRTPCVYPRDDMSRFMRAFYGTARELIEMVEEDVPMFPTPSFFKCQMCAFKTICSTYMYSSLDRNEILQEFQEEFQVRDVDHLDEKLERSKE